MREPELRGLLDAAQSRIGGARALLAHPRACDPHQCITLFREAQGYLEWVRDSLAQAGPAGRDLRGQATALAAEIGQTGILVEQAARFGRRWLQGLRCTSPEYTAYGHCVPLAICGHISVRG